MQQETSIAQGLCMYSDKRSSFPSYTVFFCRFESCNQACYFAILMHKVPRPLTSSHHLDVHPHIGQCTYAFRPWLRGQDLSSQFHTRDSCSRMLDPKPRPPTWFRRPIQNRNFECSPWICTPLEGPWNIIHGFFKFFHDFTCCSYVVIISFPT